MRELVKKIEGIIFEPRKKSFGKPFPGTKYDVIIVGTGVAGYSCAMYSARLGLKTLIVGEVPGGAILNTGRIENYPGFVSIEGQKLAELLENHAMAYEVDFLIDSVDSIKKENDFFSVSCSGKEFFSKTVVLATGSRVKKLGVPGEERFFKKGVEYCALCDATLVNGRIVAIAGGGDGAVKEAVLVSEYAKKVYVINNEKALHSEEKNMNAFIGKQKLGKIEVINGNEIVSINGVNRVEEITLAKKYKGRKKLRVEGVFIYIGREPNSFLAKSVGAKLNEKGEVLVDEHAQTNIPGFFAAGDVTSSEWKQAILAASQGVTAAYYAYKHCRNFI